AGIFDAEGSFSQTVLRINNTDAEIIGWICTCLRAFNFTFVVEHIHHEDRKPIDVVRLKGGLREHLRFFHTVCPAISRKLDITGQRVMSDASLRVVSVARLEAMRLYDITTETGDYICDGIVAHNCYARPSHAYLRLSPGLDFETRLFYKADAANLLDAELKRRLEPRAASPQARLRTLAALSAAGVPSGVLVAPVIPALTDHELEGILAAAAAAGVRWAGYVLLRLPYEIKDLFSEWLAQHYPE